MFIQVSDTPEQSLLNVVWGFIVGVVEGRSGQGGKVGLDEIEPRAVGGQQRIRSECACAQLATGSAL